MVALEEIKTIPFYGYARLHLCLRTPPKGVPLENVPDPFVRLSKMDPTGRWFVGIVKTDLGNPLMPVAVRILRDTVSGGGDGNVSNAKIDSLWEQEHILSSGISEYSGSVYTFSFCEAKGGKIRKNLPLLFCKRKKGFFSPVCPYCGRKMTECREDDLLSQVSLKPYSKSLRRYLYCPDCSPEGRYKPAFFAKELVESEKSNPLVTDRFGLISLWSKAEFKPSEDNVLPCVKCDSLERCFPQEKKLGEAAKLLYPFSFYDFYASVRAFAPFSLETVSELIGGKPVEEVHELAKGARDEIGTRITKDLLNLVKERPFYFSAEVGTSCPSATEIFALKLNLYYQVVKYVASAWNITKSPLIVISPDNFSVTLLDSNPFLPISWSLKVEPCYLTSVLYKHLAFGEPERPEEEDAPLSPLFSVRPEFMKVDPKKIGKKIYGNLLIDKCELLDSESRVKILGSIRVSGSQVALEESGFIRVELGFEQGFSRNLSVMFQVRRATPTEADLVSVPLSLNVDEIQQFQILESQPPFEVGFQFLPSYTVSTDLYSVGLMGLKLFLCNRKQSLDDVLSRIEERKDRIKERLVDPEVLENPQAFFNGLEELEELLDSSNIFYESAEKGKTASDLNRSTWNNLLYCLVKMIFSSPGTGYLRDETVDYSGVWKAVINDLEDIRKECSGWKVSAEKEVAVPEKKRVEEKKKSEIGKILQALLSDLSWLEPEKEKPVPGKAVEERIPPEVREISKDELDRVAPAPEVPKPEVGEMVENQTLTGTMPPGKHREVAPPPIPEPEKEPEPKREPPELDDLDKTIVLPSSPRKRSKVSPSPETKIGDEIPAVEEDAEKKKKEKDEEVFLDETIVIRKKPKKK